MLPRADLNSTRPPAPVEALTPAASATDAREEVLHRLMQIALGRQLQAVVASTFEDGTSLVKVEGLPLRMALPAGVEPGDTLEMALIARAPRPTFLLAGRPTETGATLSPAARLVDRLLQAMGQSGRTVALPAPAPLLTSPAQANGAQLAAALHDSLEFSGLFYESHLRQWLEGQRPTTELRREPQANQPAAPKPDAPPPSPQLPAGRTPALPDPQAAARANDAARAAGAAATFIEADAIAAVQPETVLDPAAERLVSAQLQTLEQRQLLWRGELWPGQPLEWEIVDNRNEDGAGHPHNAGGAPEQADWTSRVRFELPTLGGISATLRLSGERVQIHVDAASAGSAAALRTHGGQLAAALAAAGTPLDSLTVKQHDSA
jgi:hypothetical protein